MICGRVRFRATTPRSSSSTYEGLILCYSSVLEYIRTTPEGNQPWRMNCYAKKSCHEFRIYLPELSKSEMKIVWNPRVRRTKRAFCFYNFRVRSKTSGYFFLRNGGKEASACNLYNNESGTPDLTKSCLIALASSPLWRVWPGSVRRCR